MIFAFVLILSSILHVEMLLKVTYSAYKRKYYDSCYIFTMIYGEILKTVEKWLSMLHFMECLMPIASCQKIIINYMDTPETSHLEKVNFNP